MNSGKALLISALALGLAGPWSTSPAVATPLGAPHLAGNVTDILWVGDSGGAVVSGLGTSHVFLDGVTITTLTLAVVETVSSSVSWGGAFGALAWDADLGDELNGPGTLTVVFPPAGFFSESTPGYDDPLISPPTQDSTGALSGYALGIDQINSKKPGPSGVTFTAFTVTFTVNNPNLVSDGIDILWGDFGTGNAIGTDSGALVYDGSNSPWAGASVNPNIPEPAALSLIALGLGALGLAGRGPRSRSRRAPAGQRTPREAPRSGFAALIAAIALAAALSNAPPAGATPLGAPLIPGNSADLIWTGDTGGAVVSGLGTSHIYLDFVTPTTLTLSIVQTVSTTVSLGGLFGALAWDTDLEDVFNGPGTLTVVHPPAGFFSESTPGYDDPVIMPPTRDSTATQSGYALGIDQVNAKKPGPSGVTFTAFTVTFTVNPGNLCCEHEILWGAYGTGNAIGTDSGALIYDASNSPWAVAAILAPEPASLSLIALGLGGLALAGRGPRSHSRRAPAGQRTPREAPRSGRGVPGTS